MNCPRCGNHLEANTSFCSVCGHNLAPGHPVRFLKCDRCGGEIPAEAVKCHICFQWSRAVRRDMNFVRFMAYGVALVPALTVLVLRHMGIVQEITHRMFLLTFIAIPAACILIALPASVRVCMRIGRFWWF